MSESLCTFMAVATFRDGVTPEDIQSLVPAEMAQAEILKDQGKLGFIKVAMPQRTVFLELFDVDRDGAQTSLDSLPLAALWHAEIFETTPSAGVAL